MIRNPARAGLASFVALAAVAILALAAVAMAGDARVSGTATYRERMMLPDGAVFEAVLQDITSPDAPDTLGKFEKTDPGAPPFRFEIAYDPAVLAPDHSYAVRASVRVGGQLRFTTDMLEPVLTRGAPDRVDLLMVGVGLDGAAAGPLRPRARTAGGQRPGEPLRGYVTYAANAAHFVDCRTGEDVPVAETEDYTSLEHAYLAAGTEPGARLMTSFDGAIEAGENGRHAVVRRFIGVWPEESCDMAEAGKSLEGTTWRIRRIRDIDLVDESGDESPRQPTLKFLAEDRLRFAASVGCNQIVGAVEIKGSALKFGDAASTMMACAPPLDTWERALYEAISQTVSWRGDAQTLELIDATGATLAMLSRA